jgi:hypothetical protein
MDFTLEVAVIAAIIAAVTSLITVWLQKRGEKWLFNFKISAQHKHDQQIKIKDSIAKNKIQLINAAEELNHRLWNLIANFDKQWHKVNGTYGEENKYYFNSFVYRLTNFLWWARKADLDLEYFDTTIAEDSDLHYVKYVRFFTLAMCQTTLFEGMDYDTEYADDHFFKHILEDEIASFTSQDNSISYSYYLSNLKKKHNELRSICRFIDNIRPDIDNLRWIRLYALQLSIISFLNIYGYDFQKTDSSKIKGVISGIKKHKHGSLGLENYKVMLSKINLQNEEETKKILAHF